MLGDENNNDLIDLTAIDRREVRAARHRRAGGPHGAALWRPCFCPPFYRRRSSRPRRARAGMPVIFTNDAHIPGLDRELVLWGTHGIARHARGADLARFWIRSRPITWWRSAATAASFRQGCSCC